MQPTSTTAEEKQANLNSRETNVNNQSNKVQSDKKTSSLSENLFVSTTTPKHPSTPHFDHVIHDVDLVSHFSHKDSLKLQRLSKAQEINGELCTHRMGPIYGNENAITRWQASLQEIQKKNFRLYNSIQETLKKGQVAVIAIDKSQELTLAGAGGAWGPVEFAGSKEMGQFNRGILVDTNPKHLTQNRTIPGAISHEGMHEHINKSVWKGMPGLADPCKNTNDAKRLANSWFEALKQRASTLPNQTLQPGTAEYAVFAQPKKVFDSLQQVHVKMGEITQKLKVTSPLSTEAVGLQNEYQKLAKQAKGLAREFRTEIPSCLMEAQINYGTQEVNKFARGLSTTLDSILGEKLFTQSNWTHFKKHITTFGASSLDFALKIQPILGFINAVNQVGEENLNELKDLTLIRESGPVNTPRCDHVVYRNRSMIRGAVRFISDFLFFHIDPAAQAINPKELLENPVQYEIPKEHKHKISNERMLFALSGGRTTLPPGHRDAAPTEAHLTAIHNGATKWRQKEKEIAEALLPYPAELEYEIMTEYCQELGKKMEIPKDPFNMTPEEQAKWSEKSINIAIQIAQEVRQRKIEDYKQRQGLPKDKVSSPELEVLNASLSDKKNDSPFNTSKLHDSEVFEKKQSVLKDHLDSLVNVENKSQQPQKTEQIVQMAEEIAKSENPTADQVQVLTQAAKEILLSEGKIREEIEIAKQHAEKKKSQEIAQQLKIAFDSLNILGGAVLGCVESARYAKERSKNHQKAQRQFESYMKALNLDATITEFYDKSLPEINDLLFNKVTQSVKKDANRWIENANAYKEAIETTKKRIQECLAIGAGLNQKERLQALSNQLKMLQKCQDDYYKSKSKALQKANVVASLVQVAGSIVGCFYPPAGAAIVGVGQIASTGIHHAARQNDSRWQKKQNSIARKQAQIADIGQNVAYARETLQGHVIHLLERQQQEREVLLTPGLFQPLRRQELLRKAIEEAEERLKLCRKTADDAKTTLETNQAKLKQEQENETTIKQKIPITNVHFNYRNKQLKKVTGNTGTGAATTVQGTDAIRTYQQNKNALKNYETSIPQLAAQVATDKVAADKASDTLKTAEIELKQLQDTFHELVDSSELPYHLRPNADQYPLDLRLASSVEHLKKIEGMRHSQDAEILQEWCDAKKVNIQLRVLQTQNKLSETNIEDLPKLLPQFIAESLKHQKELQEVSLIEKERIEEFSHQENEQIALLESTVAKIQTRNDQLVKANESIQQLQEKQSSNEEITKAIEQLVSSDEEVKNLREKAASQEEELAKKSEIRIQANARLNNTQMTLDHEKRVSLFYFESLLKLPASHRRLCCQQVIDVLSSEIKSNNQSSNLELYKEQLLYCHELQRSAEWEQWQESDHNERSELFSEFFANSKAREDRLKDDINHQKNDANQKIHLAKLERQRKVEENSRHYFLINEAREQASQRLKNLSFNRTTALEGSLLSGHQQFLQSIRTEGLFQQLPQLSEAIQGIVKNLSPDWYKDKALHGRFLTVLLAVGSHLPYFKEAIGDLKDRSKLLKLEDITAATASQLLLKAPTVLINGYIHPLLGAISGVVELAQLFRAIQSGKSLPPNLEEQVAHIQKTLMQSTDIINSNMQIGFEEVIKGLEVHSGQLEDMDAKIEDQLLSVKNEIMQLESMQMDHLLMGVRRKSKKKMERMRDQLILCSDKPETYMQQLLHYCKDCQDDIWNGKEYADKFELKELVYYPDFLIGALGTKLQQATQDHQNRIFSNPNMLLQLGKHFKGLDKKELSSPKAASIKQELVKQCDSLIWLYQQNEEQHVRTSNSLQTLQASIYERRKQRLAAESAYQSENQEKFSNTNIDSARSDLWVSFQGQLARRYHSTRCMINSVTGKTSNIAERIQQIFAKDFPNYVYQERITHASSALKGTGLGIISTSLSPFIGAIFLLSVIDDINKIVPTCLYSLPSDQMANTIIKKVQDCSLHMILKKADGNSKDKINYYFDIKWLNGQVAAFGIRFFQAINDMYIEEIKEKYLREEGKESYVHTTTRFSLDSPDATLVTIYHPDSWLQENDLDAVESLSKKVDLEKLNEDFINSLMIPTTFTDYLKSLDKKISSASATDQVSVANFKDWLGSHALLESRQNTIPPLPFPNALIERIKTKIAYELDLYYSNHKKPLMPKYDRIERQDGFELSITFCNEAGVSFFSFPLFAIKGKAYRSLPKAQSQNPEALAAMEYMQLIFLLYGAHWKLGIPTQDCVELSSGKGVLVCDRLPQEGGFYEQLRQFEPFLHFSPEGKALQQQVDQEKRSFCTSKELKEYYQNYYLSMALIKLCYGHFAERYHHETVKKHLIDNHFPEPKGTTLFDMLREQLLAGKAKKLIQSLNQIPQTLPQQILKLKYLLEEI